MPTKQDFINAGLVIDDVIIKTDHEGTEHYKFVPPLNSAQWAIAEGIIYPEKKSKNARRTMAITTINGLAGQNLSSINSNADRDALLFSICYLLGICDETGLILATH